jgi:hypothetical protein
MMDKEDVISGCVHVELDPDGARIDGRFERRDRVLRELVVEAPVGDGFWEGTVRIHWVTLLSWLLIIRLNYWPCRASTITS